MWVCEKCGHREYSYMDECEECGYKRPETTENTEISETTETPGNTGRNITVIENNKIASIIKFIGKVSIILCIIVGSLLAIQESGYKSFSFNWGMAIIWWVSGLISGFVFIGFSEIINLLSSINAKLQNDIK